jgi:hypothetical protein
VRRRLFHLLNLEHGALLWVPAILFAALVLMWAMQIVPSVGAGAVDRRGDSVLILGPIHGLADEPQVAAAFRDALRLGLEWQQDLRLLPDVAERGRVATSLPAELFEDPQTVIRRMHQSKAQFYLTGEIWRCVQGDLSTRLAVWDASSDRPTRLEVSATTARGLAAATVNSLGVALLLPRGQRSAQR